MTFRTDWVVDSHPAVLDGFVTMYRDELEAQKRQEQPFVKQFYVVENLQAAPLKIERFGNLDDAMAQYQALPNHYMKALGVEKNPDPLPGSLDVLQCRNGIDIRPVTMASTIPYIIRTSRNGMAVSLKRTEISLCRQL